MDRKKFRSLIEHHGGEEFLEKILLEFYRRLSQDLMVGFFFQDKDINQIALKQKEFLSKALGFSKEYTGRSPQTAHLGLPPILPGHFNRRLQILKEVLEDFKSSTELIEEWLSFEGAFFNMIVYLKRES